MSAAEGSSSHLNRTESSHSTDVGSASNIIPCFPASIGTDAHHCETISNRFLPSHFTKNSPSQNQINYKKFMPLLGKSKGIFEK